MRENKISSAPDYTVPALVMMGVNLIWVFTLLWALFGLVPVLLLAAALNRGITWIAARRTA